MSRLADGYNFIHVTLDKDPVLWVVKRMVLHRWKAQTDEQFKPYKCSCGNKGLGTRLVQDDCIRIGTGIKADPEKKQTAERERYQADPEKKRSTKRKRYWESPECARLEKRRGCNPSAAVRIRVWDKTKCGTGRLSVVPCKTNEAIEKVLPTKLLSVRTKDIVLSEYKGGLEKAILKNSSLLVQLNDAFCKTHPCKVSADAVLKKVLNERIEKKQGIEFLKDVRAINAIKLEDSHLLEGKEEGDVEEAVKDETVMS
eukprot:Em0003g550a